MSKIYPILPKCTQKESFANSSFTFSTNNGYNPSFGSKPNAEDAIEIVKDLTKKQESLIDEALTNRFLGRTGKFLDKLSSTAGELQNLLIIGIGTAFVAPIFIAFNPLSKQDENKKKYTAMRQPVSAVIATAIGFGINMPIANAFERMATYAKLEKFDMSAKPPTSYLKSRYKGIIKHFDDIKNIDNLTGLKGTLLKNSILEDKKFFDMLDDDSIKSGHDFEEKFSYKLFESMIHDKASDKVAKLFMNPSNKNGVYQKKLKDFLIENLRFEIDKTDPGKLNKHFLGFRLDEIKAADFLKAFGFDEKVYAPKNLKTFLNSNFYKNRFLEESRGDALRAEEMFNAFKTILKKTGTKLLNQDEIEKMFTENLSRQGFNDLERKSISRFVEVASISGNYDGSNIPLRILLKVIKNDGHASLEDEFENNGKILDSTLDDFLLLLREKLDIKSAISSTRKLKDGEIPEKILKQSDYEFLLTCSKKIVQNFADNAKNAFGSYSKLQGIVLSLAVLPFSCGILNWAYPRFMEKYFPKLCESKTNSKGGK